jgi:prolyl-tRNA synthetase
MLQSKLFTRTRREDPKDEVAKNAKLLIRGGFINKEMAGVYSFLPLGLRVLNKIEGIIREEMNAIGGQEISMTALQNLEVWKKTGRDSDDIVDVWFKTELKDGGKLGLGFTHEEPITEMVRSHIKSYRDLPVLVYQFQTKFRNETRAKSGLIRGREFLMKDLYSFHQSNESHQEFYDRAKQAYFNIFARAGIGETTFVTRASGGTFSSSSDEFQTVCEAGEDVIYLARDKKIAINKEVCTDEVLSEMGISRAELEEVKAVEVGNIFHLGTKFSGPLGLCFVDDKGESKPVIMGSYGLGPARLMGTIVEVLADQKGIVWPKEVAPFDVHIVAIGYEDSAVKYAADQLAGELETNGFETLLDDREASAGEKFGDADLLGIPTRVVISPKTIEDGKLEVKDRRSGEVKKISAAELLDRLKS